MGVELEATDSRSTEPFDRSGKETLNGKRMNTLASYMVLIGWIAAFAAQIYIMIRAFRHSIVKGLLCLIIPGYVLVYATKRETREAKALTCWGVGLLTFIVGLVTS